MKLLFVGDVMLGRLVNQVLKEKPTNYPWGNVLPIFNQADWRMCNLECVISDKGRPWDIYPKAFHFRTDAKNIEVLKSAKIDAVSLANNHVLDFEYDAMFEMFKILDKKGITYAGAGVNLKKASACGISTITNSVRPHQIGHRSKQKLKIGIIAFTDNEPEWEAGKDKPGIFYLPVDLGDSRAKILLNKIKEVKEKVDLLIVSAHWGSNWGYQPPKEHKPFAHALVDAGADLIFGHSGHVFRAVETYKSKPIIYCAGDFIDDYAVDEIEKNDHSFIFIVESEGKRITSLKLYPTVIRDFRARRAEGLEAEEIVFKMQTLCTRFKTKTAWRKDKQYLEIVV